MPKRSLNSQQKIEQLDQAISSIFAGGAAEPAIDPSLAPLLRAARELRHLPRENFRKNLQSDLERSISMATTTAPAAVQVAASPRLTFKDPGKAIEFYQRAFDARETMRFELGGKIPHAEIMIGSSVIMLAEEWPEGGRYSAETIGRSPVLMQIDVPDVDAFVAHALSAGAKLIIPVKDQFYGYRQGTLADPFGYSWAISTRKEEMSVAEMHRRFEGEQKHQKAPKQIPAGFRALTPYLVAQDASALIDFVKQTFAAEETKRSIGSAGGLHAEVRIGDSMLMIGGGGPEISWRGEPTPAALHVYVEDCDAIYQRALAAGGTSLGAPVDQEYGERSASVKDAAGNYWYIATHEGKSYIPEGAHSVNPYLHPLRAEPLIHFLQRAFGAQEIARHSSPDGVIHHAQVRIGDSLLEMGEAHGPYQSMPSMFYLYVPDCDASYRSSLSAGATSIFEPKDQPYGDRNAAVKDAFGNQWYLATPVAA